MIVVLTENLKLQYFKYWANGMELLEAVVDEVPDTFLEEHKKNACFVVEGQTKDSVIISDLLDSLCVSNKHHYIVPTAEYDEYFTTAETTERRPKEMGDIDFGNTRQGKVFFNDVKRLAESTASIADTMKAVSNQLVELTKAVKEVGSSIIFKK